MKNNLESLIEQYLTEGDYSPDSRYSRRYALLRLLDEDFDINDDPVLQKNNFLAKFGHLRGASFNPMRATVKTFFDFLIQNKIYKYSNPLGFVKRKKIAKKTVDFFSDKEIELILTKCPPTHKFMFELLLNTGIRKKELINLKFGDFNFERQSLLVKGISEGGGSKGDTFREIPLPKIILEKYNAYLTDFRSKTPQTSDFVFTNPQGGKLSEGGIQGRMRRLRRKLKFRIHTHKFRSTYATKLHQEKVSILTIALLMGHEEISTTQRYIFVSEKEKREAQRKGTYHGKKSEEVKRIEELNREKQDLLAQINNLIENQEQLLNQVRRLNI